MARTSTIPTHPALAALEAAGYDDEPLIADDAQSVDEARANARKGEVVSQAEVRRIWLKKA